MYYPFELVSILIIPFAYYLAKKAPLTNTLLKQIIFSVSIFSTMAFIFYWYNYSLHGFLADHVLLHFIIFCWFLINFNLLLNKNVIGGILIGFMIFFMYMAGFFTYQKVRLYSSVKYSCIKGYYTQEDTKKIYLYKSLFVFEKKVAEINLMDSFVGECSLEPANPILHIQKQIHNNLVYQQLTEVVNGKKSLES